MPDISSVAAARKRVAGAYKDWLRETYGTQLSEMGSKKTRDRLPDLDASGAWAAPGEQNKPLAWIIELAPAADTYSWVVRPSASTYPNRIGGTFNARSPLQGVLSRVIPVMSLPGEGRKAVAHPYWEWALALVFPGRPVFFSTGSSGAVIDFDAATGALTSPIDGIDNVQPYVSAALFRLVPEDDEWDESGRRITYGQATDALAQYINIELAKPNDDSGEE